MKLGIGNTPEQVSGLADPVEEFLASKGLSKPLVMSILLCLEEVLINTVSYGYEDAEPHLILVEIEVEDDELVIEIEDDARPFDPTQDAASADTTSSLEERQIGGLGIHLVKSLMDTVSYQRDGNRNRLRMRKRVQ